MRKWLLGTVVPGFASALLGLMSTASLSSLYAQGSANGVRFIEPGQPPVVVHGTAGSAAAAHEAHGHGGGGGGSNNLSYRGGIGGTGVEIAPKIYLVLWARSGTITIQAAKWPFCSPSTVGSAVAPG